jgi:hypothetical protein
MHYHISCDGFNQICRNSFYSQGCAVQREELYLIGNIIIYFDYCANITIFQDRPGKVLS